MDFHVQKKNNVWDSFTRLNLDLVLSACKGWLLRSKKAICGESDNFLYFLYKMSPFRLSNPVCAMIPAFFQRLTLPFQAACTWEEDQRAHLQAI